MAREHAKLEGLHIQKVQRQHSSTIIVIPILVRRALELAAGDYVVFTSHPGSGVVELTKFISKGEDHGEDTGHPDREG